VQKSFTSFFGVESLNHLSVAETKRPHQPKVWFCQLSILNLFSSNNPRKVVAMYYKSFGAVLINSLVTDKHFHPSLIFVGKAWSLLLEIFLQGNYPCVGYRLA